MFDISAQIENWLSQDQTIALATVIQTWGSSPRGVGSCMAVNRQGEMIGSVSGGCVEGAVVETGLQVIKEGIPQLLHFGVSDETAWEVGLACGGHVDVFVRPYDYSRFEDWKNAQKDGKKVAAVMAVRGPYTKLGLDVFVHEDGSRFGGLGLELDRWAVECAQAAFTEDSAFSQQIPVGSTSSEALEFFVHLQTPPPALVVIGGVHIAIPLVALAKTLGYKTVVVDPRQVFANTSRFPHADRIIAAWPDKALADLGLTASTAVAALTHDPKLDDPALMAALDSQVFYIGALGSKRTQAQRRQRLLDAGVRAELLDRIHGPIGLDLGGRLPEEIALAIMAQIVQARNRLTN